MNARGRAAPLVLALVLLGGCTSAPATAGPDSAGPTSTLPAPLGTTITSATPVPTSRTSATPVRTLVASAPSSRPPVVSRPATARSSAPTTHPRVVPSPTRSAAAVPFTATAAVITPALRARMRRSWHPGCPVPLSDLRYLTLTYRGFDGAAHSGELVVAADVADAVTEAFRRLYAAGFPIRSMRLVDDFAGSDDASMAADNTSGFNCRPTTSGSGWSQHSYGRAVDLDPLENPYVSGPLVLPPAGRAFADRPDAPGVVHDGDAAVQAFAAVGWSWGGDWSSFQDYQHFSADGR